MHSPRKLLIGSGFDILFSLLCDPGTTLKNCQILWPPLQQLHCSVPSTPPVRWLDSEGEVALWRVISLLSCTISSVYYDQMWHSTKPAEFRYLHLYLKMIMQILLVVFPMVPHACISECICLVALGLRHLLITAYLLLANMHQTLI